MHRNHSNTVSESKGMLRSQTPNTMVVFNLRHLYMYAHKSKLITIPGILGELTGTMAVYRQLCTTCCPLRKRPQSPQLGFQSRDRQSFWNLPSLFATRMNFSCGVYKRLARYKGSRSCDGYVGSTTQVSPRYELTNKGWVQKMCAGVEIDYHKKVHHVHVYSMFGFSGDFWYFLKIQ